MQIDGVERDFIDNSQLHHHHPRDPEEQDVLACDQVGGREVAFERVGFFGPAKGADRPEAGGEPCV